MVNLPSNWKMKRTSCDPRLWPLQLESRNGGADWMVDFWEIRNVEDVSKTMITKGVKASRFEVDEGICFEDICTYQYSR